MALTVDFPMPMDPVSPSLLGECDSFVDMVASPRRSADARAGDLFARERVVVVGLGGGARDDAAPRRMRAPTSEVRVRRRLARLAIKVWKNVPRRCKVF